MIITKIRLQEEHPMVGATATWPLPVCDFNLDLTAGENGYILKDTKGLEPPNLVSIVEGFDTNGIPVMGSVAEKRDIALKISLSPRLGQSYSELRDDLYKFTDRTVRISLINNSGVVCQTTGYIKQFDPVYFSNQPEITMIVECVDGDFSGPASVAIPLTTLNNLHPIINYEQGTAPTGLDLVFTYTAVANGTGFSIFNHSRLWYEGSTTIANHFDLTYVFHTSDVITISTQPKNKRITLVRAGVTYDLAGYLNAGAVWPKLYPGVNSFEWTFASSWMTWNSASYIPKYWGV